MAEGQEVKKVKLDDKTVYLVFDGEWRGNNVMTQGMLALGCALVATGESGGPVTLEKRRWNVGAMDYFDFPASCVKQQTFEERCEREFWDQHPEKKAAFLKDPLPWFQVAHEVRRLIDDTDRTYGVKNVVLVSDSGRDFHYIDYYLECADLLPTCQTYEDRWRPLHDTDSFARGLLGHHVDDGELRDEDVINRLELPLSKDQHDHWPDNDAEFIGHLYWYLMQHVKGTSRGDSSMQEQVMAAIQTQVYCD